MSKSKLKIGFVLDDTLDKTDGVQQHVLILGGWLKNQGHEVHYLVGESSRIDISNMHSMSKNIPVRFNKNRLSVPLPANKKYINKKLKELNLDILHVQMPYSPLMAGKIINLASLKTKIVGTVHIVPANWLHLTGAKSLAIIVKKSLKRFSVIISVSTAAQQFAKEVLSVDSVVISNPINIKEFKHKPIANKIPKIVFLGRLVERKGCLYLLKSLKILKQQYDGDYEVIIGGKGPLKEKLMAYKKNNNLKEVKFIGFVAEEDKSKLLASADIAVFPSTGGESFGISLTEAMAAGSRVILGGDNEGYRTILSDHPDLLINPKDSKAFANRLQYFLEHKKVRKAAYNWAQANVGQYDIEIIGNKVLKEYRKVLNNG